VVSIILFRGKGRLSPRLRDLKFAPMVAVQILKVGVPALLMNMQSAFAGMLLMGLVVPFGTVAVASHSLASRVEMFLFVPGMGLGAGAGVLVGHNLGAGRPDRATRGAWLGLGIVQCFMMASCIVILVWAERLVGVFSSDPQVVSTGAEFLRIATAGYLVMAFSAVLQNSIAGAGDTVPNMVVSIASVWIIQLPLAYLLSRPLGFGIYGVRWALVVSAIASSIAFTAYFVRGRWKTRRI
jgi:Na+-driven multidrug efflux pump